MAGLHLHSQGRAPSGQRPVAYYGEPSFVYVRGADDQLLYVNLQNAARMLTSEIVVGAEIWCSWRAADTLVLAE